MPIGLSDFVEDFASALVKVDATRPVAASVRTGALYQAGIGPHTETATVNFVIDRLRQDQPERYKDCHREVPYASDARQKCDLCFGIGNDCEWSIEIKMLRIMGDNGKPNDNMLMHILSPYAINRSALTDCEKLVESRLPGKKAIMIFAYEYDAYPPEPVIRAFEVLAADHATLGPRCSATT